jgi:hypothetical protein
MNPVFDLGRGSSNRIYSHVREGGVSVGVRSMVVNALDKCVLRDLLAVVVGWFVVMQAIPGLSTLREDLRITLLNLIQFSSYNIFTLSGGHLLPDVEIVCRIMAIAEDREPWEIRRNVGPRCHSFDLTMGE